MWPLSFINKKNGRKNKGREIKNKVIIKSVTINVWPIHENKIRAEDPGDKVPINRPFVAQALWHSGNNVLIF